MNYEIKKINNVKVAVDLLIKGKLYISQIADIMGYSTSTIQRYLNDPLVEIIYGKEMKELVSNRLRENYTKGKSKGGIKTSKIHQYVKSPDGKFNGIK